MQNFFQVQSERSKCNFVSRLTLQRAEVANNSYEQVAFRIIVIHILVCFLSTQKNMLRNLFFSLKIKFFSLLSIELTFVGREGFTHLAERNISLCAAVVNQITDLTLCAVKLFQLDAHVRVCVCRLVRFLTEELLEERSVNAEVFK